MPNEFKIKNGLVVDQGGAQITGSTNITGSLTVSGGITGSLLGTSSFALTASFALNGGGGGVAFPFTGSAQITGSLGVTGSLNVTQGITGSLFGTSSFAISSSRAVTASFALTSSYAINPTISGSINNVNYIDFNTSYTATQPVAGRLSWNSSDGTLDLGMKGGNVTQQIGEEIFYEVRNETGTPIANGTLLYANGVTAGSGRITAAPFTADGSVREVRLLGMASEDISNGVNGFVTHFGYVRDLDTRGNVPSSIAVGDETWAVGDILYAHPTVAGKLTNVRPKHEISIAIIIVRHQSTGVVFTRPSSYGHLDDIHDVYINTGSLSTGDLLIYNSGSDYWTNSKQLSGSYVVTGSWRATSFTGSLFGTASYASTASFITPLDTNAFVQGGNSFGAQALLGTNDNQNLAFETSGSIRMFVSSSGTTILQPTITSTAQTNALEIRTSTGTTVIQLRNNGTAIFNDLISVPYFGSPNGNILFGGTNVFIGGDYATNPGTRLRIRGSGATLSSTALRVENSNSSASLLIRDDLTSTFQGVVTISPISAGNTAIIGQSAANVGNVLSLSGYAVQAGIFTLNNLNWGASVTFGMFNSVNSHIITGAGHNGLNGLRNSSVLRINNDISAITGSSDDIIVNITPVYNISSSYSGSLRGLIYNPTFTTSSNFAIHRAIETTSGDILFRSGSNNLFFVSQSGNVGIGTTSPLATLDVNGTARLNGLTSINTTSVANTALAIAANGTGAGNYIIQGYDASANNRFYITATGNFRINGQTDTGIAGTDEKFRLNLSFSPTSGTREHIGLWLLQTINQTGGANGITRGLFINPTLTSAADFRSIENSIGNNLLNSTSGNTYIGLSTNTGTARLQVRGSGATSSTTAFLIQNSTPVNIFTVRDNGLTTISGSLELSGSRFDMFNNAAAYGGFTLNSNATSTMYVGAQSVFGQVKADVTNSSVFFGAYTDGAITRLGHSGSAGGATYINFSSNGANTGLRVTHNNGPDLMVVTSAGNVGIGLSPTISRLSVSGSINIFDGSINISGTTVNPFGVDYGYKQGSYVGLGGTRGTQSTILGNSVFPGSGSSTVRHTSGDVGSYIRLGIGSGITFHTNITSSLNVDIAETTNEVFRVTQTGNVGIGTSSPTSKLHVSGAGSPGLRVDGFSSTGIVVQAGSLAGGSGTVELFAGNNNNSYLRLASEFIREGSSGGLGINVARENIVSKFQVRGSGTTSSTTGLRVENNNASASFVVRDDSNVGIGTASPITRLHVSASGNVTIGRFETPGSTGRVQVSALYENIFRAGSDSSNTEFWYDGGFATTYIDNNYPSAGSSGNQYGDIRFRRKLDGTNLSTVMTIRGNNGNVGIGTTTPNARLDISGSAIISGSLTVTGGITGSLFGTASFATNAANATSASYALTASFALNGAGTNAFIQGGNSFGAQALLGTNDNQNLALETNNTIRMFVSSSGRVGIGTTTPREQLEVNGAILSRNANPVFVMQDTSNADNNALYLGAFFDSGFPISYGTFAINRNPTNGTHFNPSRASAQINLESNTNSGVIRFYSTNVNDTTPNLTFSATPLSNIIIGPAAVGNEASARLHVRGSGATLSTTTLLLENNTPASILTVRDDGRIAFGSSGASNAPLLYNSGDEGSSISLSSRKLAFVSQDGNVGTNFSFILNNPTGITTGTLNNIVSRASVTLSSGNTIINQYLINPTLALSGTYSGTVRGIFYNPTATISAGTHRAIETTSGDILFRSGSNNLLFVSQSGNVGIGTITPNARLDVNGNTIMSGSLTVTGSINGLLVSRGNGNISTNISIGATTNFSSSATGTHNFAAGNLALSKLTTGIGNTAIGQSSLLNNATGSNNTAIGRYSLYSNKAGIHNTAIGLSSLLNNTYGNSNTAIGYNSLASNTVGNYNTSIGRNSLRYNTIGFSNTAIGNKSLYTNSTGNDNTAIGRYSLQNNISGISNTAIGIYSLSNNTYGNNNTAIGQNALLSNITGNYNTAIGLSALASNTLGESNTAIGGRSLEQNTTGSHNIAFGYNSGKFLNSGANNTITNNSIFIGKDTSASANNQTNQIVIGNNADGNGSNTITLGDTNITGLYCAVTTITSISDARDKANIYPIPFGLEYIKELNPVKFDWNKRDGTYKGISDIGFIAQDLDNVQNKFGLEEYTRLVDKSNPEQLQASYMRTYPIMVKAIQELSEMVSLLQQEIKELKNK